MSAIYVTAQNDRLDRICRDYYGSERGGNVEAVLAANLNLADLGPIYAAGVEIVLPDITTAQQQPTKTTINLWD